MRALILVHRWLGVACCLLFAMWFASGIVMHFVPFPAFTESERIDGLAPVDSAQIRHGPGDAVIASQIQDATRIRLLARPDGVVYLIQGTSGTRVISAADLSSVEVRSERLALAIAVDYARRRGMDNASATLAELADYDQWTVPNGLDPHRPLYRIALNDGPGTELYVSSATGEVVRDTTRGERHWNYAGSIVHWIYPTALRRDWRAWDATVWTLSLVALIAAIAGALLGLLRINVAHGRVASPYQGWHAWHHWLGLGCMTFVLTWILSGWLSMDHGRLFSTGTPAVKESVARISPSAWEQLSTAEIRQLPTQAREIEWFAFDGRIYRRDRLDLTSQQLSLAGNASPQVQEFLAADEVRVAAKRLAADCGIASTVPATDDYAIVSKMPRAPVYRVVCGEVWFHFDGANGAMLEKLDASRRAYRWLYEALHTLNFPAVAAHPMLRTILIVVLCGLGLAFSLTAIVIGWRRLRR